MTEEKKKVTRKPTQKGAVALVRRVQRYGARIGALAERKREALERLKLATLPVEVDGERYDVVEPKGRYIFFAKLDLVKIPRSPRSGAGRAPVAANPESEAAA